MKKKVISIGIFSPSSRLKLDELNRAIRTLEHDFSLTVKTFGTVSETMSAQAKADLFLQIAFDPHLDLLLCARGGESCADFIPFLEPFKTKFQAEKSSKIVMGMSDNTPLLLFLAECGWKAVYGHVASFFSRELTEITRQSFAALLQGEFLPIPLKPVNRAAENLGNLDAEIIGGNLTLLHLSLKESWEFQAAGKILFFEDWHEKSYAMDRTLKHLERIGKFSKIKGLIWGNFLGNLPSETLALNSEEQGALRAVLERFARRANDENCPVFEASYVGHVNEIRPILLGKVKIADFNLMFNT